MTIHAGPEEPVHYALNYTTAQRHQGDQIRGRGSHQGGRGKETEGYPGTGLSGLHGIVAATHGECVEKQGDYFEGCEHRL